MEMEAKWNDRDEILLFADDLTISFIEGQQGKKVVHHAGFYIKKGEAVAIVGGSGAGKTTLMRVCMGLSPSGSVTEGHVFLNMGEKGFQDICTMSRRERDRTVFGKKIAMVFQDPAVCLNPSVTIGKQLTEGIRLKKNSRQKEAEEEAVALLQETGMEREVLSCYPCQLSGGMRQRIAVLLALIPQPELLICDEPSASLDVLAREQIFDLIDRERKKRPMAVVYITHDMEFAAGRAEYIHVMQEGRFLEKGSVEQIFTSPKEVYTRQLLKAAFRMGEDRFKIRDKEMVALENGRQERDVRLPLLEAEGLCRSFRQKNGELLKAVDEVSFRIYSGEIYGLVGESGAGKSTVGKILMHVCQPEKGVIRLGGEDYSEPLSKEKRRELYRQVQMIFQDPAACLNPSRKVLDIVAQALDIRKERLGREERKARVCQALQAVGLSEELTDRYPGQLSGGQRQRVGIARTIIASPRLVIVDEAVSALDPLIQLQVADLLKELQEQTGMSMLFISHDLPVVQRICNRVGVMHQGRIVEEGETEQIFSAPSCEYTKRLFRKLPGSSIGCKGTGQWSDR